MVAMRRIALRPSVFLLSLCLLEAAPPPPIRVLILDGVNNHDWRAATQGILKALPSPAFEMTVSTSPEAGAPASEWTAWKPDFTRFHAVIVNFNGGHTTKGLRWPPELERSFELYLRSGGGVVFFHAANNAFLEWPEYNRMIGLGWRPKEFGPSIILDDREHPVLVPAGEGKGPGHGPRHDFEVVVRDPRHPITRDLPKRWMHPSEQLTHGQHGLPTFNPDSLTILTYAWSKDALEFEPLDWISHYGKGRVYVTMLGHTWKDEPNPNLSDPWFQRLLANGVRWVAAAPANP